MQGRPSAGIQFSILPFRNESLVRSGVIVESNAVAAGLVRLRGVTELHHMRELRAQKMAFNAPIWSSKANPRVAGVKVRIISSSTLQ